MKKKTVKKAKMEELSTEGNGASWNGPYFTTTESSTEITVPPQIARLPPLLTPLAVDYPSESLNDMARKINEIISHLNK